MRSFLFLAMICFSVVAQEPAPLSGVLLERVQKVAPADGLSVGEKDDKATWRIDFKPEATPEQRIAAQQILQNFDATVISVPKSETDKLNDKINILFAILGVIGTAVLGKAGYDKLKADTKAAPPEEV